VALAALGLASVALDAVTDAQYLSAAVLERPAKVKWFTLAGGLALGIEISSLLITVPWFYDNHDELDIRNWFGHLLLPCFDAIAYFSSFRKTGAGVLLKNVDDFGALATSALGGWQLLFGATLFVVRGSFDLMTALAATADILANLLLLAKFLRMSTMHYAVGIAEGVVDPITAERAGRVTCTGLLVTIDVVLGGLASALALFTSFKEAPTARAVPAPA
jgi:hypothetical protein